MKYPAELYRPSPRPYHGLDELHYPFHDRTMTVTQCGRICFGHRKINLSTVFAGQNVGIIERAPCGTFGDMWTNSLSRTVTRSPLIVTSIVPERTR
jgi:hypothetical protein